MTLKDVVIKHLTDNFLSNTPDPVRYGVFLDGQLLNFRDRSGKYFLTKGGAKSSMIRWNYWIDSLLSKIAPLTSFTDPKRQESVDKRDEAEEDLLNTINDLFKEGRLEIKPI